ncbi:MAG: signal peptide peptidase SppA [Flavobacteriales bacterium]
MRQFLKFMLASMVGTLLIGVVLLFLFFGAIAAMGSAFSFQNRPATVKDGSVLRFTLDEEIVDRGEKDHFNLDFGPFRAATKVGLNDLLADLEKAKTDDRIKGVFLDLGFVNARTATLKEVRDKLVEFRASSGKPVVAFADMYTQGSYYLASAADQVYLVPEGDLDFRGLRSEMMFFKGLFNKLGVDIQFIRGSNNKFKSFGEVFTEDHMSPANREQMTVLLNGLWDEYLNGITGQRKLDKAKLNSIAEGLQVRKAQDAVDLGLIDGVKYRDEVLALLKERMGLPADKDIAFVSENNYASAYVPGSTKKKEEEEKKEKPSGKRAKLAVVFAQGDISDGEGSDGSIGSTTLSKAIRDAREDSTVKAIVLRVNSPGGSGLASDIIWREVDLARKAKPVVVSMGDVAASGGYYISCAADRIYAEPNTITGSIGVFGMIPNMQGFFNDKLGITFDGVQTHKYAGMLTTSRPLSAEEKTIIQGYVDRFYGHFKQRVAEGRHLTVAQVDSIGQGRVWTGTDALRIGLVDELGGLEAAIAEAAKRAGLEKGTYTEVGYPEQEGLFQQLMKELNGNARAWVVTQVLGTDADLLQQFGAVRKARGMSGIQARMPFDLDIH